MVFISLFLPVKNVKYVGGHLVRLLGCRSEICPIPPRLSTCREVNVVWILYIILKLLDKQNNSRLHITKPDIHFSWCYYEKPRAKHPSLILEAAFNHFICAVTSPTHIPNLKNCWKGKGVAVVWFAEDTNRKYVMKPNFRAGERWWHQTYVHLVAESHI